MKDKQRKRSQRGANKIIRELNKNVATDDLWQGRFKCKQIDADWYRFDDGSGGILYMDIRIIDKKTGYYKDFRWDHLNSYVNSGWHVWEALNDFIVKDLAVWEIENPRENKVNWNNVQEPLSIWRKERNYFLPYNVFDENKLK